MEAGARLLFTDLDSLFSVFDKDGNGRITFSEMCAAASALGLPFDSQADAEHAFATMTGGQEECTQERFVQWWSDLRYVVCLLFVLSVCPPSVALQRFQTRKVTTHVPHLARRDDDDMLKAKLHKRLAFTVAGLHKTEAGGSSGVMFG